MARRDNACCATPGCRNASGHGIFGNFCELCAERLAGIKLRWDAERAKKRHADWDDDTPKIAQAA
jgi:hypothetical protein